MLSFGPGRGFCRLGFGVSAGWGSSLAGGWPLSPMAGRSRPVPVPSAPGAGAPSAPGTGTERRGVMRVSGGTGGWPGASRGLRVTAPDHVVARALWFVFLRASGSRQALMTSARLPSARPPGSRRSSPGRPPGPSRHARHQAGRHHRAARLSETMTPAPRGIPSVGRAADCLTFLCHAA